MNVDEPIHAEQQASKAFDKQSPVFDELYSGNAIIQYKRERVRQYAEGLLKANSRILELNSGTGEDAIHFARRGYFVHVTDLSGGMMKVARQKIHQAGLEDRITTELCSFTKLDKLVDRGPYDMVFSNFAGLNCTDRLDKVVSLFPSLLKPGGTVVMVILPGFCAWESLLFFKGKFRTAFRRMFSSKGRSAKVEGMPFKCWYYSPQYVKKLMQKEFQHIGTEGLCTVVPPSYFENFDKKHPALYEFLKKKENRLKSKWPWRSIGDYYIISFRKK